MENIMIWGLGLAGVLDWTSKKIPNWLTWPLALTGLIYQITTCGFLGLAQSTLGFLLGITLLYLPFALGGIGGGDVKLMAAIGACVGPALLIQIFLASAVVGGIFSAAAAIQSKTWGKTMRSLKQRLIYLALHRRLEPESAISFSHDPVHIPYAVSIMIGYLIVVFLGGDLSWGF